MRRTFRRWAVAGLGLALAAACGVVEEDGAWLSERSWREARAAASELEARGETLRAAEIYEALALGFPDQHGSDRALSDAARCRQRAALQSRGPLREDQMRRSAELWGRLLSRAPAAARQASAHRHAAVLWALLGDCHRALPHLRQALPLTVGRASTDAELERARRRCGLPAGQEPSSGGV